MLTLHKGTSLEQICKLFTVSSEQQIIVTVQEDHELQVMGEGMLELAVEHLRRVRARVHLAFFFHIKSADCEDATTPIGRFLLSSYGLALTGLADKCTTIASDQVTPQDLRGRSRSVYRNNKGSFPKPLSQVKGAHLVQLVSVEALRILPPCVQLSSTPDLNKANVRKAFNDISDGILPVRTLPLEHDRALTVFIEAFDNAYDEERKLNEPGRSTYGANRSGVYSTSFRVFPYDIAAAGVADILPSPARQWLRNNKRKNGQALAITVTDLGRGIQDSLRDAGHEESDDKLLLLKSFNTNATSKSETDQNTGTGLGTLYRAAGFLNAFLFIKSGPNMAFRAFEEGQESTEIRLDDWPHSLPVSSFGTVLGLIWHLPDG